MTIVSTRLLVSLLCLAFTAVLYLNLGLISGVECPAIGLGVSRQTAPTVNGTILSLNTTVVDQAPCDVRAQNDPVERRSKILQATMLFGINYAGKDGRNWKTWQSHVEHAKKWGYEDHLLERIMVGEGDWSGFIWSKTLHSLQLVLGELRKPLEQRAEWLIWYDADTLILNHEIPWELFLPQGNSFSDIHLIATKNLDGFNAGILIMRIHQWTVEFLADAYALPRLRPEVDLVGNVDQNALRWTSNREEYKSHVLFQPQNWYNGFQGPKGYETEIVKGDMLVHFAGINQDYNEEIKKTIMDEWFGKMKNQTQAWQVPIEQTRYPNEINDFWAVLKDARELLSTVDVRIDTSDPINAAVIAARDELKWAIEEEAFDTARVRKTASDMIQALEVAKNQQQPIPPVVDAQGDAADGGAPRAADAQAATAGQNDGSEQLQQ